MLYSDGSWQASRRSFPTVGGTLVRRTPLRKLFPPLEWQRHHYLLDERPEEPVQTDTMLGAFLLLRRAMLDEIGGWDAGYRMYCEDIDLNYRAAKAGWERWYVPGAVVHHEYAAVIDKRFLTRHTIWHARAMVRFLRKHPERLLAIQRDASHLQRFRNAARRRLLDERVADLGAEDAHVARRRVDLMRDELVRRRRRPRRTGRRAPAASTPSSARCRSTGRPAATSG